VTDGAQTGPTTTRRWQTRAVRWERLFADLESQLEAAERDEFETEVSDRTRREVALVELADRLRAAIGGSVSLTVMGAGALSGVVRRTGAGWLLLDEGAGREVVLVTAALVVADGLPIAARRRADVGAVASRLGLSHVLRSVARDRAPVHVLLRDGSQFDGTIDRVGADFVDVADHPTGEPRRPGQVRRLRTVGFEALSAVRAG
jgi:hypothetical protein